MPIEFYNKINFKALRKKGDLGRKWTMLFNWCNKREVARLEDREEVDAIALR